MEELPEIELRGLRCLRGGNEALKGVDLRLARGETLFAMGVAGSGKSVLLKAAAGIILPSDGEVLYRGVSLARMSFREMAAFRKASGFVFQDAALWANLSLFDNLALPLRLHEPLWSKAEVERAVAKAADLVGYRAELRVRPAELSAGERKLIGLARALVLDPELLFMDDPSSGLDEASASRVPDIVDALKARGRSMLVACASSVFASRCADRIAVLLGGSLAAAGSYDEAAAWTDPAIRGVTGRLRARPAAAPSADSLAGRWAAAIAEDELPLPDSAPSAKGARGAGMSSLGDMINSLPDEGPSPEDAGKDDA